MIHILLEVHMIGILGVKQQVSNFNCRCAHSDDGAFPRTIVPLLDPTKQLMSPVWVYHHPFIPWVKKGKSRGSGARYVDLSRIGVVKQIRGIYRRGAGEEGSGIVDKRDGE